MSFRYRKVVRIGKFARINLTKTGIGGSVGVPGARISTHSSGRLTTTVGAPGTGAYLRKDRVVKTGARAAPRAMPAYQQEVTEALAELTEADWDAMTDEEAIQVADLARKSTEYYKAKAKSRERFTSAAIYLMMLMVGFFALLIFYCVAAAAFKA